MQATRNLEVEQQEEANEEEYFDHSTATFPEY